MVLYFRWVVCSAFAAQAAKCSNDGITTAISGPARSEAVLHGCGTSSVEKGCSFAVVYMLAASKVTDL